jgi:hypothetical protein
MYVLTIHEWAKKNFTFFFNLILLFFFLVGYFLQPAPPKGHPVARKQQKTYVGLRTTTAATA